MPKCVEELKAGSALDALVAEKVQTRHQKHYAENRDTILAKQREYYQKNKKKIAKREKVYRQTSTGKKVGLRKSRRYAKNNPSKRRAHEFVKYALREGILKKPKQCSMCPSDWSRIEGHHFDYSRPEWVLWVCSSCHRFIHKALKAVGVE